jgi:NACHT domain
VVIVCRWQDPVRNNLRSWQVGMRGRWWRRIGVSLVLVAGAMLAVGIPLRARFADTAGFDRLVGWANIFALSVGVLGVGLWFVERRRRPGGLPPQVIDEAADQLAVRVLEQESRQRAALLGVDSPNTVAANVRFDRLVQFRQVDADRSGDLTSVGDFYESHTDGRLVILGEPGAGKTVLALELLVQLLERRRDCADPAARAARPVPVRLSLPGWNTDQPFARWLAVELQAQYGLADRFAAALVQQRRILPVLDGLDEMDGTDGDPVRARAAVAHLNQYLDGRSGAALVVACRFGEYARLSDAIRPAVQVGIRPLTVAQITDYLHRNAEAGADHAEWEAWQPLLAALRDGPDEGLLAQISTPWRMMLAVTFHRDGGDLGQLLPTAGEEPSGPAAHYAARVGDLLLGRFVPARTRLCEPGRYRPERVTAWMRHIAAHLAWQADHGRSGSDIVLHEWWPIAGVDRVRRWHAGIAAGIVVVCLALAGLAVNDWSASYAFQKVHDNIAAFGSLSSGDLVGMVGFLLLVTFGPYSAYREGRQMISQPAQINLQQVRTHQGRRRLASGFAVGLPVGLPVGLGVGLTGGPTGGPTGGLTGGLAVGLTVGLASGLRPIGAIAVGPHDPLRNDGTVLLVSGLVGGLAVGLESGLVGGLVLGLAWGLAVGLAVGLAFGLGGRLAGNALLRYTIAVVVAARTGIGPLAFARFLKWAYYAGLLRISGNAYQIRHSELRDWLQRDHAHECRWT